MAAFTPSALAQAGHVECLTRAQVGNHLEKRFKETVVAHGLAHNGTLIELFSNENGVTWTLVISVPSGESCVILYGTDLQMKEHKLEGEGP